MTIENISRSISTNYEAGIKLTIPGSGMYSLPIALQGPAQSQVAFEIYIATFVKTCTSCNTVQSLYKAIFGDHRNGLCYK